MLNNKIKILVVLAGIIAGIICVYSYYSNTITTKKNQNEKPVIETKQKEKEDKTQNQEEITQNVDNKKVIVEENSKSSSTQKKNYDNESSNSDTTATQKAKTSVTNTKTNNKTNISTTGDSNTPAKSNNQTNSTNISSTTNSKENPLAVDETHPLYRSHRGNYNNYGEDWKTKEECDDYGFYLNINDSSIKNYSCLEVYANNGIILGYYLEVRR